MEGIGRAGPCDAGGGALGWALPAASPEHPRRNAAPPCPGHPPALTAASVRAPGLAVPAGLLGLPAWQSVCAGVFPACSGWQPQRGLVDQRGTPPFPSPELQLLLTVLK